MGLCFWDQYNIIGPPKFNLCWHLLEDIYQGYFFFTVV